MSNSKKRHKSNVERQKYIERKQQRELQAKKSFKLKMTIFIAAVLAVVLIITGVIVGVSIYKKSLINVNGNYAIIEVKGYGTITVLLDRNAAPETVERFATLANSGFYDGLTFHRVISDFMIQGGDPNGNGTGGYIVDGVKSTIKGEFSKNGHKNDLKFARGVLGMARGEDYNSASSQFFICNSDSSKVTNLDGSYAAFGRVIEGIEVVDAITSATASHATDNNGSIPKDDQAVIRSIRVVSDVSVKGFGPSVWTPGEGGSSAPKADENETEEDLF